MNKNTILSTLFIALIITLIVVLYNCILYKENFKNKIENN